MSRSLVQQAAVASLFACLLGGCGGGVIPADNALTQSVADKASDVASQIGGSVGYGGSMMSGYFENAPAMMGFQYPADLADPNATQTIVLRNESSEEATFHVSYFASYLGQVDHSQDVVVGAGQVVEVEIPCSEIVGMGPLAMPGGIACHLADGVDVGNTMAVPIFLGMDFLCTEKREFVLTPDRLDLDLDGNVDELIVLSDGFVGHMQSGGPMGGGMMGSHMMMGDFNHWDDWYSFVGAADTGGAGRPGMMGWGD